MADDNKRGTWLGRAKDGGKAVVDGWVDANRDAGLSLLKGAVGVPEAMVGLFDMTTGSQLGKKLEEGWTVGDIQLGLRSKEAKAYIDSLYSEGQKAAFKEVQDAQGFQDTVTAAVRNPSVIIQTAVEAAPGMVGGGGAGTAVKGLRHVGGLAPAAQRQLAKLPERLTKSHLPPNVQRQVSTMAEAIGSGLAHGQRRAAQFVESQLPTGQRFASVIAP